MTTEWKSTTVPLIHPFTVGERSFTAILLKEPDADALEKIEDAGFQEDVQPTMKQMRIAICALSGQPNEIIGKLHRDDFKKVSEAAVPLLQPPSEDSPPGTTETLPNSAEPTSTKPAPTLPTG